MLISYIAGVSSEFQATINSDENSGNFEEIDERVRVVFLLPSGFLHRKSSKSLKWKPGEIKKSQDLYRSQNIVRK